MRPSIDEQIKILERRCDQILSRDDLRKKLARSEATGKPLRIKLGMDPTAPDVHLGHAVPLGIVRQFQEWGHKAVLIIGDYTARVGDPTGRNQTRKVLTGEEIDANAKTYVAQVGKLLRTEPESLEIRYNSEWLGKMGLVDIIKLASRKSVAQVLAREDFAKRYAEGVDIRLHEILYPLLQGWDSVVIEADVEMGGSDQLFNNLVGREFQKDERPDDPLAGQVVIVTPLLVGTDGVKKMSKSLKNYVGVTDAPTGNDSMFGKTMSVPDALMDSYYQLLTDLPEDVYKPLIAADPRAAKFRLAKHVVAWLHSPESGEAAAAEWDRLHPPGGGKGGWAVPDNVPEFIVPAGDHRLTALMVTAGLVSSNGEATRKIKEGAVYVDGAKATDFGQTLNVAGPVVLKLGKRFARVLPG